MYITHHVRVSVACMQTGKPDTTATSGRLLRLMGSGKLGKLMLDGTLLAEARERESRDRTRRTQQRRATMVGVGRRGPSVGRVSTAVSLSAETLPNHPLLSEAVARWKGPKQLREDVRERIRSGDLAEEEKR